MKKTSSYIETEKKNHFQIYKRHDLHLVKGEGCEVWDAHGRKYIDALGGIAVNILGHSHPRVVKAIQDQAEILIHVSNLYYNTPQILLAQKLAELSQMDRVMFCNSGAEALEGSVKLARKYASKMGKKGHIISMDNCFHGRTLAAIAMGKDKYQQGFEPMPEGFAKIPFNDNEAAEKAINENTIAVAVEPVQGEGGIHVADLSFLKLVRELCDKHKALLIFDEVQCGIGRIGEIFAWKKFGIKPDIIATAKGLGGGVPIGAILAREEVAAAFGFGDHGTTFGGNPLACATALATISEIEDKGLHHEAERKGNYFMDRVRDKTNGMEQVKEIRGMGLMLGIELTDKCPDVVNKMIEKGVLANCAAGTTIRLLPALTITTGQIDAVVDVMVESIREVFNDG